MKRTTLLTFLLLALFVLTTVIIFTLHVQNDGVSDRRWLPEFLGPQENTSVQFSRHNAVDDFRTGCGRHVDWEAVHVTITADRNYFMGVVTLINSIVRNTASPVMFHLVTHPHDAPILRSWISKSKLKTISYEIIMFSAERFMGKIKISNEKRLGNPLNYARILLPDLLPCVGRVIFIDADCLVLGDIRELYAIQLQDGHLAAALRLCDVSTYNTQSRMASHLLNYDHPYVQSLQVPEDTCMFNAGVLLADLVQWEGQHVTADMEEFMDINMRENVSKEKIPGGGSQIILFAVIANKYTPLPIEWNVLQMKRGLSPKVMHWHASKPKPWLQPSKYSFEWTKFYVPDPDGRFQPVL